MEKHTCSFGSLDEWRRFINETAPAFDIKVECRIIVLIAGLLVLKRLQGVRVFGEMIFKDAVVMDFAWIRGRQNGSKVLGEAQNKS